MNTIIEKYLSDVDKYLKPLPLSERVDIIKEIKSTILEMERGTMTTTQILEQLGSPKDLAKSYLSSLLTQDTKLNWKSILVLCAFYTTVGFSSMIVIPFLAIMSPALIFVGIVSPILIGIKMVNHVFNLNIPYVAANIVGIPGMHPIGEFMCYIILGPLMYIIGKYFWKLLISYCHRLSIMKKDLIV